MGWFWLVFEELLIWLGWIFVVLGLNFEDVLNLVGGNGLRKFGS